MQPPQNALLRCAWGNAARCGLCLVFTVLAAGAALTAQLLNLAEGAFAGIAYLIIPHAIWLGWLLLKRIESGKPPGRID
jgi:hypothetical protein